ncbi:MAG: hypothetical protein FWF50_03505 [Defluviitaleaceae bacterium]|nr:hypothetical protein [Defluviitaleaceae bacterium]
MNRKEEVINLAENFLLRKIEPNFNKLEKYLEENKELIVENFSEKLNELFELAIIQQKASIKEPIEYMYISFLRSSMLVESYEFCIDLFNEMIWLDKEETTIYFPLKFIFQYIDQDIEDMKSFVNRKIPQFNLDELKYQYSQCYIPFAALVINKIINEAISKTNFYMLQIAESFKVLFGGYMEKGEIIHIINRGAAV